MTEKWSEAEPDYDENKEGVHFQANYIMDSEYPIGKDLNTNFMKFHCIFFNMIFGSRGLKKELHLFDKKQ